jgi:hypothetical protein
MENPYDYSKVSDFEKAQLPEGFQGNVYNISYKWLHIIPESQEPLKIMEIGAYHGANICSYMKTYAKHEKTEVHAVDPWYDYSGYNEYQTKQPTNYSIFINNISKLDPQDLHKIYIHRGLSENIVPTFENESYDMIYIDGNHEKRYVVEDCVICFKKVKKGGWIIIDDLQDKEVNEGVQLFLQGYHGYFEQPLIQNCQLFMKRTQK